MPSDTACCDSSHLRLASAGGRWQGGTADSSLRWLAAAQRAGTFFAGFSRLEQTSAKAKRAGSARFECPISGLFSLSRRPFTPTHAHWRTAAVSGSSGAAAILLALALPAVWAGWDGRVTDSQQLCGIAAPPAGITSALSRHLALPSSSPPQVYIHPAFSIRGPSPLAPTLATKSAASLANERTAFHSSGLATYSPHPKTKASTRSA